MGVLRAVLRAVGLLVVLVLAVAVVGLAVAILAVMVMQAGGGGPAPVPAPVPAPARRPAPTRSLLMAPAIQRIHQGHPAPVTRALATTPVRDTVKVDRKIRSERR